MGCVQERGRLLWTDLGALYPRIVTPIPALLLLLRSSASRLRALSTHTGRCCIMVLSIALAFMTIVLVMKILGYISI